MSLDEKDPVDEIDVILLCRMDGTLETDDLFRLNNYGTLAEIPESIPDYSKYSLEPMLYIC